MLVELAREARRKGWWHRFGPVMPSWLEPYLGLEAEAARLRDFQSMVLPGLVQTEDYTRAILRAAPGAGAGPATSSRRWRCGWNGRRCWTAPHHRSCAWY